MVAFVERHRKQIRGVLSCWDRVVIRGTASGSTPTIPDVSENHIYRAPGLGRGSLLSAWSRNRPLAGPVIQSSDLPPRSQICISPTHLRNVRSRKRVMRKPALQATGNVEGR